MPEVSTHQDQVIAEAQRRIDTAQTIHDALVEQFGDLGAFSAEYKQLVTAAVRSSESLPDGKHKLLTLVSKLREEKGESTTNQSDEQKVAEARRRTAALLREVGLGAQAEVFEQKALNRLSQ